MAQCNHVVTTYDERNENLLCEQCGKILGTTQTHQY